MGMPGLEVGRNDVEDIAGYLISSLPKALKVGSFLYCRTIDGAFQLVPVRERGTRGFLLHMYYADRYRVQPDFEDLPCSSEDIC